ncbi:MAG: hypothetical protein M3Y57_07290 [Acidobacteriota bacterium]|nr:hypothetical protein [Acidobacteriota bacterium]
MRLCVLALVLGTLASAQTFVEPGQLGGSIAHVETPHDRTMQRLWIGSMLAMAGATAFDAASSWGKSEGNGFLASPDGTFGARGLSIKAAIAAAVIVPQLLLRRHKELNMKFLTGNFVQAGIFTAVSVHNLGINRPSY